MIWFTSDWHIGHKNIIEYCSRPFRNVEEMTEGLVARHNAVVRDDDDVYHVGDVALNDKHIAPLLARLNGRKHLVPGNHDRCHPCHKGWARDRRRYLSWGFVEVEAMLRLGEFDVCHLPYSADRAERMRYAEWRPVDEGRWLLHGHVHSPQWERVRERQIDVGVDAWDYTPVSIDRLCEIAGVAHATDVPATPLDEPR